MAIEYKKELQKEESSNKTEMIEMKKKQSKFKL